MASSGLDHPALRCASRPLFQGTVWICTGARSHREMYSRTQGVGMVRHGAFDQVMRNGWLVGTSLGAVALAEPRWSWPFRASALTEPA